MFPIFPILNPHKHEQYILRRQTPRTFSFEQQYFTNWTIYHKFLEKFSLLLSDTYVRILRKLQLKSYKMAKWFPLPREVDFPKILHNEYEREIVHSICYYLNAIPWYHLTLPEEQSTYLAILIRICPIAFNQVRWR